MRTSEIEDNPKLSGLIWQIFGYESKYSQNEFLDKIEEDSCSWIFDGKRIRLRMNDFLDKENLATLD